MFGFFPLISLIGIFSKRYIVDATAYRRSDNNVPMRGENRIVQSAYNLCNSKTKKEIEMLSILHNRSLVVHRNNKHKPNNSEDEHARSTFKFWSESMIWKHK